MKQQDLALHLWINLKAINKNCNMYQWLKNSRAQFRSDLSLNKLKQDIALCTY